MPSIHHGHPVLRQMVTVGRILLKYLVENPRRLLTHDELLKQVWGGVAVSESAVRTHLPCNPTAPSEVELRQALGEA
jgi:DNA-binding winged helix-turn-helix (wHTH) protein